MQDGIAVSFGTSMFRLYGFYEAADFAAEQAQLIPQFVEEMFVRDRTGFKKSFQVVYCFIV